MSEQKYNPGGFSEQQGYPGGYQQNQPPPPPYEGHEHQQQQQQQQHYQQSGPQVTTVYHVNAGFGPDSMRMTCPSCHQQIQTSVNSEPGLGAWITGIVIALFGCICGCCLIPCCIDAMKVFRHSCPNCKAKLGTYKGSASLG